MKSFIFSLLVLGAAGLATAGETLKEQVIEVKVTENGFEPSEIDVKPGTPVVLNVTRMTDSTCSTSIQVPTKKIKHKLPLNKSVRVDLGILGVGEIRFGCGMNMMEGGRVIIR